MSVVAALALLPTAGSAVGRGSPSSLPRPQTVLGDLQVTITTTSNWTAASFSKGQEVGSRLRGQSGDGTWIVQSSAVAFQSNSLSGTKRVTADLLYLDTSSSAIRMTVTKGQVGTTTVTVRNETTGRLVGTLVDAKHTSPDNDYAVSASYPKASFIGRHSTELPRVDPRKLVLAFYYPWYTTYRQPGLAQRPADPRSAYSEAGVLSMTRQAKANGISGFIASWAGEHADGDQFRLALKAADKAHQVITGYLESVMAANNDPLLTENVELQWLRQLLQYRHNRAFLKTKSGEPIVFVYVMDEFSPGQWQDILRKLNDEYHLRVALVGDSTDSNYLPFEYGVHSYAAVQSASALSSFAINTSLLAKGRAKLYPGAAKKLVAYAVSPGYDDQRLRGKGNPIVSRDGGKRYEATWQAALAGQPDWVLITTWNEWYEDTAVEPGAKTGSRALQLTKAEAAAWRAS